MRLIITGAIAVPRVLKKVVPEMDIMLAEDEDLNLDVPVDTLSGGAEEDAYLSMEVESGKVLDAEIDEEAARGRRERVEEKMERLRDRGRESSERVE